MKSFVGEYGKIIVLGIFLIPLILFIFGSKNDQLLGLLSKARPETTVTSIDNIELVKDIGSRAQPAITVSAKKLVIGNAYNLLDETAAENEDGEALTVTVVKVFSPGKEDITSNIDVTSFKPAEKGSYEVTYHAEEIYLTVKNATDKTVVFIAD